MERKVYVVVINEYFKNYEGQSNVGVFFSREDALKEYDKIKNDFINDNPDYFLEEDEYEVAETECHYEWLDEGMGYYFEVWVEEHIVK